MGIEGTSARGGRTSRIALCLMASPLALVSAGWALPALAQDAGTAPAAAPDSAPVDIVVTGSRLRSPDATSTSPISTIGGAEIQARGATRVEDLINTLPQAFADQGGGNRGGTVGASGTATINLRNLGNQRTLVLIDGRRLMQGDPARSAAQAADINNIPAALIERIDVVTGGASAVYGSDALAGVVNFVLKRDFSGIRLDANAGVFGHNNDNRIGQTVAAAAGQVYPTGGTFDGGQQDISLTVGRNFADGRGNVTAFVGYRSISGVGTAARDFSTCNLAAATSGYACSLSSTTYPAQFQLTNPVTGATRGSYTLDATTGNTLRTYRSSDGFNNGNTYDLQAPDQRVNADLFARYSFSPAAEAYGEFMFMRDRADIRLSPTGVFSIAEKINCNNPFLSAQEVGLICTSVGLAPTQTATVITSLRNAPGGSRHDYTDHNSYRGVLGLRGAIGGNWRYDVYAQYGRTDYWSRVTNDFSLARFATALQAVRNGAGQIVCVSADPACVPLNLFQTGQITPAALGYITNTVYRTGFTEEKIASASLTGDLGITSPLATHPVALAFGAEYRDEKIAFRPDRYYSSFDVAGNSGGEFPIAGSFDVKEVYGEARLPLIEGRPFFRSLAIDGGVRVSQYSTAGNATAYKAGAEWAPVAALRLRGSYQRAVRAPNLVELFGPVRSTPTRLTDPCEGTTPTATFAQCQASGVTAAQYGNIAPAAGQQSATRVGGNAALTPEKSDTWSFGGQLAAGGLRLSVDWFDIDVKRLINTVPATITLAQCISTGVFCDQIVRNPATGSLVTGGFVNATTINAGYLRTSGIDIALSGGQDLASVFGGNPGRLSINFAGTRTTKYEVQILPGSQPYRCDGYFGLTCGQPIPHWRHRLLVNWSLGAVSLGGTWRFVGAARNDRSSDALYLKGTYQPYDLVMASRSYFDLAASVDIQRNLTFRIGVNNLFDKDPPLTASVGGQTSNGAFFGGMYDALGRYMFAGVTARY